MFICHGLIFCYAAHSIYKSDLVYGETPLGNWTLNTKAWLSKLNPEASLYLNLPKSIYPALSLANLTNCFEGVDDELTILCDKVIITERENKILSITSIAVHRDGSDRLPLLI